MSNRKLWLLSSSGTLDSILHDKGHKTISVYNFLILHLKCLSDPGPKSKLTQATVHPDSTINNIQIMNSPMRSGYGSPVNYPLAACKILLEAEKGCLDKQLHDN